MNRVHPRHRPERYSELRHIILTFHDSTVECVAMGYEVTVEKVLRSPMEIVRTELERRG